MILRRSKITDDEHVEVTPLEARAGSRTKVNFVILIVSTLAAGALLLVFAAPLLGA